MAPDPPGSSGTSYGSMFWEAEIPYDGGATGVFGAAGGDTDSRFEFVDFRNVTEGIREMMPWIKNQQPAHISQLAEQFAKAVTALIELENWLFPQATQLYNEHWTKSEARDAFMLKGPGTVLAYIHQWKMQLSKNQAALRSLIDPIKTSQTEMATLYQKYLDEMAVAGDADNMKWNERLEAAYPTWTEYLYPNDPWSNEAQKKAWLAQRAMETQQKYDKLARELVAKVSDAYFDAFFDMAAGTGSVYEPPNVVMWPPGQELFIPPGGAPGGPGGAPSLAVAPPPPPPAFNQQQLQQLANGPQLNGPPTTVPGGPPTLPGGQPGGPPLVPQKLQNGLPPPGPPGFGGLGPTAVPRNVPGGMPGGAPGGVPAARTGVAPNSFGSMPPPPGIGRGLARGGVLGNPNGQGSGALPPPGAARGQRKRDSTLRSPASNYTSTSGMGGAPGGRMTPPPGAGAARRRETSRGVPTIRSGIGGVPEAFGLNSMPPPVAPVLGRQSRRSRQSDDVPAVPPMGLRGGFAPPTAAPSVLNASTSRSSGTLPPPGGIPQQQRSRRGRQVPTVAPAGSPGGPDGSGGMLPGGLPGGRREAGRYTGRPTPNLVGNPNWMAETGPDDAGSTAPVLRGQPASPDTGLEPGVMLPPQQGATAPVLSRSREAVRRAMAENRSRPGAQQHGQTERELARRSREADHHGRAAATQETREGEEAFTVQTPGGAVLAGGPAPTPDEGGPRPSVGNS